MSIKKQIVFVLIIICSLTFLKAYQNPIITGFNPDPSIEKVGDDFYLVTSSFEYFPGLPVYHSKDLIHWELIGHVIDREEQAVFDETVGSGRGIWAPSIRYHDGTFYVVVTWADKGNYLFKAENPAGPWSKPVFIDKYGFDSNSGIDPSLTFLDGKVYYHRSGYNETKDPHVYQVELDPNSFDKKSEGKLIWDGVEDITEAPHLYRIDDYYYLIAAEGGTGRGHMEVCARSDSIWGPYEECPYNPILTHRNLSSNPIYATGHADFVKLDDDSWWAVFLANRNKILGRETFLAPVNWTEDGWPLINNKEPISLKMEPDPDLPRVSYEQIHGSDYFESTSLKKSWMFVRSPDSSTFSLTEKPGWLRLQGNEYTMDDRNRPAFICQRQKHMNYTVRTKMKFDPQKENEKAGIMFRMFDWAHYDLLIGLRRTTKLAILSKTLDGKTTIINTKQIPDGIIYLKAKYSSDSISYYVKVGDKDWIKMGDLNPRNLPPSFMGLTVGMYATGEVRHSSTPAYFDWFKYDTTDNYQNKEIPGRIEAENFYKQDGVQIQECSEGGENLASLNDGDWVKYDLAVNEGGDYLVKARIASGAANNGGKIKIYIDETSTGIIEIDTDKSDDWQDWYTAQSEQLYYIPEGEHQLKIEFIGQNDNDICNLNWLEFIFRESTNSIQGLRKTKNLEELVSNHPNPFNSKTNIEYNVTKRTRVKIEIYDLTGNKIKSLIDQFKNAGRYITNWYGTNYQGEQVSAGLYIYSAIIGENRESGKMLFLK